MKWGLLVPKNWREAAGCLCGATDVRILAIILALGRTLIWAQNAPCICGGPTCWYRNSVGLFRQLRKWKFKEWKQHIPHPNLLWIWSRFSLYTLSSEYLCTPFTTKTMQNISFMGQVHRISRTHRDWMILVVVSSICSVGSCCGYIFVRLLGADGNWAPTMELVVPKTKPPLFEVVEITWPVPELAK